MRIRYDDPSTAEIVLVEMHLNEHYDSTKSGIEDTTVICYTGSKPDFIYGNSKAIFTKPLFRFALNASTGSFEPFDIRFMDSAGASRQGKLLKADFIKYGEAKDNFLLTFFTKEEEIYQNFRPVINSRSIPARAKNIKMHLLAIGNSNDTIIGIACEKDMHMIIQTFRTIASFMGFQFRPDSIYANRYNKKNVEKAIKRINPSKDDIIIIYFSGHGFRKKNQPGKQFPFIDLRSDPRANNFMSESINIEEIYKSIVMKGARLNLVLSDCCNSDPYVTNAIGTPIPKPRDSEMALSASNCIALFMDIKPVSILATAADIGQRATCNSTYGGFFSYFFKASLKNMLGSVKPIANWDQLFQEAQKNTVNKANNTYCDKPYIKENICRQVPRYLLQIGIE